MKSAVTFAPSPMLAADRPAQYIRRRMPYTLSHAAAVLPFCGKGKLVTAALVIGAFSPDFEHLVRLRPLSHYSHSLAGLFLFCVPASLLVFFLYNKFWRKALHRWWSPISAEPQRCSVVLVGLSSLLGAATHLVWDSFTHQHRWGPQTFDLLNQSFGEFLGLNWTVWKTLQHVSTALGLLVVWWFLRRESRRLNAAGWLFDRAKLLRAGIQIVVLASVLMVLLLWWMFPVAGRTLRNAVALFANNVLIAIVLLMSYQSLSMKND